jgi:hypothetical protein
VIDRHDAQKVPGTAATSLTHFDAIAIVTGAANSPSVTKLTD